MVTAEEVKMHIDKTLGLGVAIHIWTLKDKIPHFLRVAYRFRTCQIMDIEVLLILDRQPECRTPGQVRKHIDYLSKRYHQWIVYVADSISSYNRHRLINQTVPFIVPGNQLYLPFLGIDLREYYRSRLTAMNRFSPATQCLFVFLMIKDELPEAVSTSFIMENLDYSRMTLSRCFKELKLSNAFDLQDLGREKAISFKQNKKNTWKTVQPFLRNPVKKRFIIDIDPPVPPGVWAGITALSQCSMLSEPEIPVVSMSQKTWNDLDEKTRNLSLPPVAMGRTEIEIWIYDPSITAANNSVDPLSFYLSLKDTDDERVLSALEELLEGIKW